MVRAAAHEEVKIHTVQVRSHSTLQDVIDLRRLQTCCSRLFQRQRLGMETGRIVMLRMRGAHPLPAGRRLHRQFCTCLNSCVPADSRKRQRHATCLQGPP